MITVCCWLWNEGYRDFQPKHVNILQRMVARNLQQPHRFVCITEETEGFNPDVEVIQTPKAAAALSHLQTPEGVKFPSCYRRLWMFSAAAKVLGEQVLLVDIDLVVTGDLGPVVNRNVDFMGWRPYRDWGRKTRFGGGLYLLKTGTRTAVWEDFKGAPSIAEARHAGFRGSDQAWISFKLGEKDPYFERTAGIYSIRDMLNANPKNKYSLPGDARLVQFNGPEKPWSAIAMQVPWVQANFR